MRAVGAVVLLGVFAALVASASGSPQRAEYRFRQVASGFDQPVYLAQPKSEPGRLYVVERPGRIISLAGGKRRTFLDIRSRVESFFSSLASIFESWVGRRQSVHTQRAYREDVMSFVKFAGMEWPDQAIA